MEIKHLKLNCANLDEQKHFYTRKFNFKLVEEDDEEITLQIGSSRLSFSENRLQKSYYHFAFNVPYGSLQKALGWVRKRVEVIATPEDGEIQDFSAWQAHSLYFLDPAGNVVELIGRKRFNTETVNNFSANKILNISEVGLPVFEVSSAFQQINKATGLPKFDCTRSNFCAAGDDRGLLILVDKAEKAWFPTDEPARPFPLVIDFSQSQQDYQLIQEGSELRVSATED